MMDDGAPATPREPRIGFQLSIGGEWTAAEMSAEIAALSYLHDFMYYSSAFYQAGSAQDVLFKREFFLAASGKISFQDLMFSRMERPLDVTRIQYGSPGFQDFLGVGKVVAELLSFVKDIITIGKEYQRLELNNQLKQLEIQKKRAELCAQELKNVQTLLKVLDDAGYDEAKKHALLANLLEQQAALIRLAQDNKIVEVEINVVDEAA